MINVNSNYKKALKVIESCTNIPQLENARNYANLFVKNHSEVVGSKLEVDSTVWYLYENLLTVVREKETKLSV